MLSFYNGHFVHLVALLDCINNVLAFDDLTEYGVNAVQVWLRAVGNEELASACVLTGMCH